MGNTGCCYQVMVDEHNLRTDEWASYELTAELVAEAEADIQRRIAAREEEGR